ncbi:MAG: hypothetical protein ACJ71Z_11785 [Aeromicrobium sp.]
MTWKTFRRWSAAAFVVGLAAGALWWSITDTATFTITRDGADIGDAETRRQFGAIVNFVFVGAGVCSLMGLAVAFLSDVSWPAIPAVALMSGQSAVLAWLIGGLLGPDEPTLRGPVGSTLHDSLGVDAIAPFVAWAVFGVAGVLLGIWLFEHEPNDARAASDPQ